MSFCKKGLEGIDHHGLYEELVRMRLNTNKLRLEYIERIGGLTPEMSAGPRNAKFSRRRIKKEEINRDEYLVGNQEKPRH